MDLFAYIAKISGYADDLLKKLEAERQRVVLERDGRVAAEAKLAKAEEQLKALSDKMGGAFSNSGN